MVAMRVAQWDALMAARRDARLAGRTVDAMVERLARSEAGMRAYLLVARWASATVG